MITGSISCKRLSTVSALLPADFKTLRFYLFFSSPAKGKGTLMKKETDFCKLYAKYHSRIIPERTRFSHLKQPIFLNALDSAGFKSCAVPKATADYLVARKLYEVRQ